MKVIRVENQVEGAKVALEILKEKLAQGAKTLGLAYSFIVFIVRQWRYLYVLVNKLGVLFTKQTYTQR